METFGLSCSSIDWRSCCIVMIVYSCVPSYSDYSDKYNVFIHSVFFTLKVVHILYLSINWTPSFLTKTLNKVRTTSLVPKLIEMLIHTQTPLTHTKGKSFVNFLLSNKTEKVISRVLEFDLIAVFLSSCRDFQGTKLLKQLSFFLQYFC